MISLTAKQEEIARRESKILDIARPIVVQEGYHRLNMDRIASQLGLSKGTIYNHFSCKEEIVIALAAETATKRADMFRKAAQFRGCSRFRMLAIGQAAELFVRQSPEHFLFEQIIRLDSIWEKTSEKRRSIVRGCEASCMEIAAGIVRDAVASSEIDLPETMTPEGLVFGLWSLTSGGYSIVLTSDRLDALGLKQPYEMIRLHVATLADGFNWKPLSSEFDLDELINRINQEVFSGE